MTYSFRIRFTMGLTVRLDLDVRQSVLHSDDAVLVVLKAADAASGELTMLRKKIAALAKDLKKTGKRLRRKLA